MVDLLWRVEQADCIAFLNSLEPGSVDLVFGSPPYEKARLYLENGQDMSIARDTEEWVAWMVEVYRASLRVCKGLVAYVVEGQTKDYRYSCGPALLMANLHRADVHLRKPPLYVRDGIPGSGGPDWLKSRYEWIVCATNGGRLPWSDNTAMGHTPRFRAGGEVSYRTLDGQRVNAARRKMNETPSGYRNGDTTYRLNRSPVPDLANPGNLIDCGADTHFGLGNLNEAPFPEKLAEFFIRSFCPEGGLVVDPFSGSGTTGAVALCWGRRFAGCDLRQSQVDLSRRRIKGEETMFDALPATDKED